MAGVIKQFRASYVTRTVWSLPDSHVKAMKAIEGCRTPAFGGHVVECGGCGVQDYAFHSCGHRACPRCMAEEGVEWVEARRRELLPVPYFHVVFSVPEKLQRIIRAYKRTLYPVLMSAAASALQEVSAKPKYLGGTIGVMATLHTWSRTLFYHPHVHCLVPAGSVDKQGRWRAAQRPYLAPTEVLAKAFQAKLCAMMRAAFKTLPFSGSTIRTDWQVHVEQPMHGADTVLQYLARSLYRGPLYDHRILDVTDRNVLFDYPDRDRPKRRAMELEGHEFLRRFLQHVWPNGIHKVRYFGLWSRKARPQLEALRQQLQPVAPTPTAAEVTVAGNAAASEPSHPPWLKCPHCGGQRVVRCHFHPGASPPPFPVPLPILATPPPVAQPP